MCACVQGGDIDGDVQCEMDPVCEVALKAEIMDVCGLSVVGWYHSHPGFGCWLSGVDVGTQKVGGCACSALCVVTGACHRPTPPLLPPPSLHPPQ